MRAAGLCSAIVAAALAAGAGCAARHGQGGPAVAVLEVRGAGDARWQERVADLAAARRIDVIAADDYWIMARRLRALPLTARNVARVASTLGASAVVHGRVTGKANRRQLVTIYVRDGESGRVVEKYRVRLRRGVPARRGEARLERRLLASVAPRVEAPARKEVAPERTPPRHARTERTEQPERTSRTERTERPQRTERDQPRPARAARPREAPPAPKSARRAEAPAPARPPPPVEYDARGQAIDDEMPAGLAK